MEWTMVFPAELLHPLGERLAQRNLRYADQRQREAVLVGAQESIQPGEFGSGKVAHYLPAGVNVARRLDGLLHRRVVLQQRMEVIPTLAVIGQQTEVMEQVLCPFV